MQIRRLKPSDAQVYIRLRREMLADSPWAFAASPEDDHFLDVANLEPLLQQDQWAIVGAFDGEKSGLALHAAAGVSRETYRKMAHRAHIWGVYVTPTARGHGLGREVVLEAIRTAKRWSGVDSVSLSASANSAEAIALYKSVGFVPWGVEPRCAIIDGQAFDEVHMVLSWHPHCDLSPADLAYN